MENAAQTKKAQSLLRLLVRNGSTYFLAGTLAGFAAGSLKLAPD